MTTSPRRTIITFLLLTFGLSTIFFWATADAHTLRTWNGLAVLGLAWSPGIAGMFTKLLTQRDLRGIGWGWGKTKYQAVAYAVPLLYLSVVYGFMWLTGLCGVPSPQFIGRISAIVNIPGASTPLLLSLYIPILATIGVFWGAISAAGEEIGWRGVLIPELLKITSYTRASFLSGIIWAVWHYPLIFLADYNAGTPLWYGTICFTVMIVGTSFGYAWLRLRSGSVWTAVLFHAAHNVFIQSVFDPLSVDYGNARYFITEFGAGLALAGILVGVGFWTQRRKLPTEPALLKE